MEKYIGRCLDSLLIPEIDQVEVLVVNDGSHDRSSEIAHSYAERYPNSIRVIDKVNGNYGSCINKALPFCTGRYVKILDADDTFNPSEFSKFVQALTSINSDVIITCYKTVDVDGQYLSDHNFNNWMAEIGQESKFEDCSEGLARKYIDMHRIAYNIRIFNLFPYSQTEGICYTDTEWATVLMAICRTYFCLDVNVYRYTIGRDGQSMSPDQLIRNMSHLFIVLKSLIAIYNSNNKNIDNQRLFNYIINRHKQVYFIAVNNWQPAVISLLQSYDEELKNIAFDVYEAVAAISYTPEISYKPFKKIREMNFSVKYRVPLWVKGLVSLNSKINNRLKF